MNSFRDFVLLGFRIFKIGFREVLWPTVCLRNGTWSGIFYKQIDFCLEQGFLAYSYPFLGIIKYHDFLDVLRLYEII